jgi:hypothetical protein
VAGGDVVAARNVLLAASAFRIHGQGVRRRSQKEQARNDQRQRHNAGETEANDTQEAF